MSALADFINNTSEEEKKEVYRKVITSAIKAQNDLMSSLEEDEEDFLTGKTCNPDAPEECESCQ